VVLDRKPLPRRGGGNRLFGISNDLLAVLAYPAFAATDASIQAVKLVGTEHRAPAYYCLRFRPIQWQSFGAEFNHTQLNLNTVPPDVLHLGQHIINLLGPISVCYLFTTSFILVTIPFVIGKLLNGWNMSLAIRRFPRRLRAAAGVFVYVFLNLTIFFCCLGDLRISFLVIGWEALNQVGIGVLMCGFLVLGLGLGIWSKEVIELVVKRDTRNMGGLCQVVLRCLMILFLGLVSVIEVAVFVFRVVPDSGYSWTERD
jgi:hypothetical protein